MNSWARRERVDQLLILDPVVNLFYVPELIQFTCSSSSKENL